MSRKQIAGLTLVGVVVLALAVPYLIPLSGFIPTIEEQASKTLGMPVAVKALRAHLLPTPRISLHEIRVGKQSIAELSKIVVIPRVFTLLNEVKVIDRVVFDSPVLPPAFLAALGAIRRTDPKKGAPSLEVRRVEIYSATLKFPALTLSGIDATVDLGNGNSWRQTNISLGGGRATVIITPAGNHQSLKAVASKWKLPVGPPVLITKLDAKGVLSGAAMEVSDFTAEIYGGQLKGDIRLSWRGGWRLQSRFQGSKIRLEPALALVKPNATLGGLLDMEGQLSGEGMNAAAMWEARVLTSKFNIQQGVLRGVDLLGAVKELMGGKDRPKDTKFDELKGLMETSANGTQFSDVQIESGLLHANGDVFIGADKSLDGSAKVQVKGTGSLIGTPLLVISGTTDAPKVRPSKAVMTGAAVGTAVLGPGLGTALGMKAGEITNKLFGRKSKPKETAPSESEADSPVKNPARQ